MNILFSRFRNLLLLLPLAGAVHAADLAEAKRLHYRGCEGDRPAAIRAERWLTELSAAAPADPVIMAYLGSARMLAAARAWQPLRKLELTKQGAALLDDAVAAAPDNLEIRFLRGASLYHLPAFFNKRAAAETDFRWVVERLGTNQLEPALAAAALYYDGLTRARHRDHESARRAWQTAVALAPDSKAGKDAAARLK